MTRVRYHRLVMAVWLALAASPIAAETVEGPIKPFLKEARLEMQQVFKGERFPNVVVTMKGTVLATFGSRRVRARRSEDGGKSWGEPITIADPGFQGGGLTVDETSGDVLAFVEERHPPAPLKVYRSKDGGKTWTPEPVKIHPDSKGNVPSMHMNEHGITLRHGKHKGRLLRPSRWYAGRNERSRWPQHYTNAIYSDDDGRTWRTSDPFPAFGTGEATVAELSDGRIYYNSRRHWAPEGENPRRRWTAWSDDGGQTWKGLAICKALPDGPRNTDYGCMGGLVRLPVKDRDILIYSNCDSAGGRDHGTVWASFDGGRTWPIKRLVYEGRHAYSSLTAGRPGTPSEGWIYQHFEGGPKGGSTVARFNLTWILGGKPTGDGDVPDKLSQAEKLRPIRIAKPVNGHIHPAACVTPRGTIVVTYGRVNHRDLRITRSKDGGRTWSEPTPFVHTVKKTYYPGSLTTLKDGRIVHAWNRWSRDDNEKEPRSVLYSVSKDEGLAWSEPQPLPREPKVRSIIRHPFVELSDNQWLFSLSDKTFVYDPDTKSSRPWGDGRVHGLIPIVRTPKGTFVSGQGLRSADEGKTWAEIKGFPNLKSQGWRHEMVCLSNGWLLASEILGPGFGGERIRYRISHDDGVTWDHTLEYYAPGRAINGRACPRTVQLDDNTIGVVFYDIDPKQEGGPGLFFLRIPLARLAR